MGKESPIDQFELSPLAQQKMQELLAVLAEDGFGDGGRPPKETDFATIEEFGHQAGRYVARALDERLTQRHAEHFQQSQSCPTCRALTISTRTRRSLRREKCPDRYPAILGYRSQAGAPKTDVEVLPFFA